MLGQGSHRESALGHQFFRGEPARAVRDACSRCTCFCAVSTKIRLNVAHCRSFANLRSDSLPGDDDFDAAVLLTPLVCVVVGHWVVLAKALRR